MLEPLLFVVAGLVVGGLIGLTGIGGGSLLTPILVFGFGQSPAVAVGTALGLSAVARLVAAGPLGAGRQVDWRIVRRLSLGSLPAAAGVLLWLALTPRSPGGADRLVLQGLAFMLLATGLGLLAQGALQRVGLRLTAASLARVQRAKPALTIGLGTLIGIAVSLTSIGGGALASAALVSLYPLRLSGQRLVATSIAYALPLTVVAALGHAALGQIDVAALGLLLLGAIPAVLLARRATWRLAGGALRPLLGAALATCAAWMLGA